MSKLELGDESDKGGYGIHYDSPDTEDTKRDDRLKSDPESFEFRCIFKSDVERIFNESVQEICDSLPVTPSIAKLLLHTHSWNIQDVIKNYKTDATKLLVDSKIMPPKPKKEKRVFKTISCATCLSRKRRENFAALACNHYFCKDCWFANFELQIRLGITSELECMGHGCSVLIPEDFVLEIMNKSSVKEKYQELCFNDYVNSHPNLCFCPGINCRVIIFAKQCQSKRVTCVQCKATFCFKCGSEYHAPLDCETLQKWLKKCADDSETLHYLSAFTKNCPKCQSSIEKKGGCSHMQCCKCKAQFCWVCVKTWSSQHYACLNIPNQSLKRQAKKALAKYLLYYERWSHQAKSLRFEEENLNRIRDRIEIKIKVGGGTWMDWQYLFDAANLLATCRHSLKYTYPYAYYMKSNPRKKLFERQQAELQVAIENLSRGIEGAETTGKEDLELQMDVTEKYRNTLLKDFFKI